MNDHTEMHGRVLNWNSVPGLRVGRVPALVPRLRINKTTKTTLVSKSESRQRKSRDVTRRTRDESVWGRNLVSYCVVKAIKGIIWQTGMLTWKFSSCSERWLVDEGEEGIEDEYENVAMGWR